MRLIYIALIVIIILLPAFNINHPAAQAQEPDAWDDVREIIEASTLTNLVVMVGNEDGIVFEYAKGADLAALPIPAADLPVPIASSSKWWTGALILSLVEEDMMSLDDHPQDYLEWWTDDPNDPRSQITLAHLISMTSGFEGEPPCMLDPVASPEDCARVMYDNHFGITRGNAVGEAFYYSSSHMHIAGVMAHKATGESPSTLFRELIADPLGMAETTGFTVPSTDNPWMAGGGVSSTRDYATFLHAIFTGEILADSREVMFTDRTPEPVQILQSPVAWAVEWHYGFGVWRECQSRTWVPECDDQMVVSSGGGLGFFPWIDLDNGYYAVIGRVGGSGAVADSIILSYEMRPAIVAALAESQ